MTPRTQRFDAWKARPGRPTLVDLLEASQDRVFALCQDVLHHRHDAEEAAQETLLEIVLGIDGVRDGEHYESWLRTVARRTALDRLKARRRRNEHETRAAKNQGNGVAPIEGLQEAIGRLGDSDRALILERYFERRTLDELAAHYGVSDAGIRKRIRKAQGLLKRMLAASVVAWGLRGGSAWGAGVTVMKTKTAAILVVILIPFFVLGAGVWVGAMRQVNRPAEVTQQSEGSQRIAAFLSEAKVFPAKPLEKPPAPAESVILPADRARMRAEVVASLEQMRFVRRRSAECKELWPLASTEEEGRALQREKIGLDREGGELHGKLCELAAQDPGNIVEMVRTARDLPERLALMGLIAPDVNAEISSETAAGGPLLTGLLSLAQGDPEEKAYFAAFAGALTRANNELGKALVTLMGDPDFHVRKNAGQALRAIADQGALKEFLKGHIPALKQAALRRGDELDYLCVGAPLNILASIGVEEADDFVLHRFESMESKSDFETIAAAIIAAPRISSRHEARLVMAILRAIELPGHPHLRDYYLQVAEHLPQEQRATIATAVDGKEWHSDMGGMLRMAIVRPWERTVYRSMTGVSRWRLNASSGPGIERSRF